MVGRGRTRAGRGLVLDHFDRGACFFGGATLHRAGGHRPDGLVFSASPSPAVWPTGSGRPDQLSFSVEPVTGSSPGSRRRDRDGRGSVPGAARHRLSRRRGAGASLRGSDRDEVLACCSSSVEIKGRRRWISVMGIWVSHRNSWRKPASRHHLRSAVLRTLAPSRNPRATCFSPSILVSGELSQRLLGGPTSRTPRAQTDAGRPADLGRHDFFMGGHGPGSGSVAAGRPSRTFRLRGFFQPISCSCMLRRHASHGFLGFGEGDSFPGGHWPARRGASAARDGLGHGAGARAPSSATCPTPHPISCSPVAAEDSALSSAWSAGAPPVSGFVVIRGPLCAAGRRAGGLSHPACPVGGRLAL